MSGATRPLVVIGLDACDPALADALMDAGRMPRLAALTQAGRTATLVNPPGIVTRPVWPTIMSGAPVAEHLSWTWRRLVPGTYRVEKWGPSRQPVLPPFWVDFARHGVRCALVDVPHSVARPEVDAVQVVGWRHHASPADGCDALRDEGRLDQLSDDLRRAVPARARMVRSLLDEHGVPDLLAAVFHETHCAGHQFLHLHLPDHPDHDAALRAELGDVLADTYEACDHGMGEVIDAAADAAGTPVDVVVLLSHGMAPVVPLLDALVPFLDAMEHHLGQPSPWRRLHGRTARWAHRTKRRWLRRLGRRLGPGDQVLDSSLRFFPVEVYPTFGGIRLNLAGREPRGRIPAAEADAMIELLERELRLLTDGTTGRPLVRTVWRIQEVHPHERDAGLPDLLVEWDVIDRHVSGLSSPTLGDLPYQSTERRPGNHLPDGRVVLALAEPSKAAALGEDIAAHEVAGLLEALLSRSGRRCR